MSTAVATRSPRNKRDLTAFGQEMEWDERFKLIRHYFAGELMGPESPETHQAWVRAFSDDPELMGRILGDIIKSMHAVPGRPGPRPALDRSLAGPLVDRWLGRDPVDRPYSYQPFAEALAVLAGRYSVTQIARVVGLSRSQVFRLLRGEIEPTRDMMVRVAKGFGKEPSYFTEYRVGTVVAAIMETLSTSPEQSVRSYEALFWAAS